MTDTIVTLTHKVTGETREVAVPVGAVAMLALGAPATVVALTWVMVDPTTCPEDADIALAALVAVEDALREQGEAN